MFVLARRPRCLSAISAAFVIVGYVALEDW
jgi:hypothetical protein